MRRLLLFLAFTLAAVSAVPAVTAAAATTPAAGATSPAGATRSDLPDAVVLPDGFAPEDLAIGSGASFYVGSLVGRGVYTGDLRTGEGRILVPGQDGRADVGMFVDGRNRLWVTGGPGGDVRVYDARSGEPLATYPLTGADGFISDVLVTRDAAYLTDSFQAQLYAIPLGRAGRLPDPSAVSTIPLGGDIVYSTQPIPFNANGIEIYRGQLVVGQTNTGKLFTVDPDTGLTDQIDLGGETVYGADGIVLRGRTLFVSQNFPNLVAVVRLDRDLASGRVTESIADPRLDVPTAVATSGDALYAVNARLTTPVTPTTSYDLIRLHPSRRP